MCVFCLLEFLHCWYHINISRDFYCWYIVWAFEPEYYPIMEQIWITLFFSSSHSSFWLIICLINVINLVNTLILSFFIEFWNHILIQILLLQSWLLQLKCRRQKISVRNVIKHVLKRFSTPVQLRRKLIAQRYWQVQVYVCRFLWGLIYFERSHQKPCFSQYDDDEMIIINILPFLYFIHLLEWMIHFGLFDFFSTNHVHVLL